MSCRFCGKQFNRGYNLRRHEKEYCPLNKQEENMSYGNSDIGDISSSDEGERNMSSDSYESETMSDDNEMESEEEEEDPWYPLINEAKDRCFDDFEEIKDRLITNGQDEQTAKTEAYFEILPKLQKQLANVYAERLSWISEMKNDPVHRKIMKSKRDFIENDDFEPDEALEAAIDKRKFLIRRLLKDYQNIFDEEEDESDD